MKVRVFIVLCLISLMVVASCDSSDTPKYLEFASDVLLPQAPIGIAYEYTFTVTYGEEKWDASTGYLDSEIVWGFDNWKLNSVSKTAGPANMTFSEGKISGTADIADSGLWSFDVTIQKGKNFVVETFYMPISLNIEITSNTILPPMTTDIDYATYFTANHGKKPYYWSFDNWTKNGSPVNDGPIGINIGGSGFLTGKAANSEVGHWTVDVTVFDTSIPTQLSATDTFEFDINLKLEVPTNYPTIQAAVDVALDVDTVYLSAGTYQGPGNRDVDFGGKSLTILGDPQAPDTVIIDCEGSYADPHRAFYLGSGEQNCVIDGLTITKGQASSISSYHRGGAIYGGDNIGLTIQNCVFKENHTQSQSDYIYGGVIYVENYCNLNISNCLFDGNKTTTNSSDYIYGGTLYVSSESSVTMENVEIKNSRCTSYYYIYGGEFYLTTVDFKFKNVNIHHGEYKITYYRYIYGGYIYATSCSGSFENVHMGNGYFQVPHYSSGYPYFAGAIMYLPSTSVNLTNCVFANNSYKYLGSYSYIYLYGFFYLTSGSSKWEDCIVANNVLEQANSPARYYGGIAYMSSHQATFNRCHFIKNKGLPSLYSTSTTYQKGGIGVYSSSSAIINDCVFAYNSFQGGGGAVSVTTSSGSATINNSTFYKNYGYYAGSMYCYSSNIYINNSIMWGNSGSYASEIYVYSTSYSPTLTNTCFTSGGISGSYNPISCISSDPYFRDTGDNPVTGDCTFSDATMTVTGTPGTSAFLTEIMRGDMIFLTADGETKALVVTKVVSDSELEVAGYYDGTPGTGAATVRKMDFTPQHTSKGDANDSPCVDSGDNSKSTSSVDIAGNTRFVDGNGNSTATVDMGAYELQ